MKKIANFEKDILDFGAIGSEVVAKEYGLNILKKNIGDNKDNTTRFFVISKKQKNIKETEGCKTSLAIHPHQDRPGLLLDLLKSFSLRGINLTKIESRPAKANFGEYIFYIDFNKHQDNLNAKKAIKEIRKIGDVKIFGSYKGGY
jgi:prephenate dehydratase